MCGYSCLLCRFLRKLCCYQFVVRNAFVKFAGFLQDVFQKLEAVLEASWQVFTTEAVSQQQVSDAAAALQKAIDALAESVPGDVDSDGQLTMNDLNMIKDFVSGKIAFTPEQIELADFDKNGVVNVIDLLQWKLQLAGK